jgi:hypothetical protein
MVATAMPPALRTANLQATNIGVFVPRIRTRLPGRRPSSVTSTLAMRLALSRRWA